MITVIDYGMGNSGSIMNILSRIGAEAVLTSRVDDIAKADKLVLPGVGAFDNGMQKLNDLKLIPVLNERVVGAGVPILGICLGMQLFAKNSEEGAAPGLGWIDANVIRFQFDSSSALIPTPLRIPHMGWNTITVRKPNPLFEGLADDARFYFVHSYHIKCCDSADILATAHYGMEFTACVARDSVIGVQFHPEKSLRWGMEVFRKFAHHVGRPSPTTTGHAPPSAHHSMPAAA